MFRIDKSFVENMNNNKEFVVITPKEVFENAQKKVTEKSQTSGPETAQDDSARAERILKDAQNEAREIKNRARQEGYSEGRAEAQQEMETLIREQTEDAKRVFAKLEEYKQNLYSDLADNVLSLSFDIAEKIINFHLKKDDTLYVEIVREAIRALNSSAKFTLRVSRSDYERFFKKGGQWLKDEIGCAPFEVMCDPYMAENGCIVDSDEGVVNAGVTEQLRKLRRILDGRTEPDEL